MPAAEGLIVFVLGVLGFIAAILWLSVPFILYSIRTSLQEIGETLDDLLEVELEIARRLGPRPETTSTEPSPPKDQFLDRPLQAPTEARSARAPRRQEKDELSLRQQAEQIRRSLD